MKAFLFILLSLFSSAVQARTALLAPLILYVNLTTGSDLNDGLTPLTAFQTAQAAINHVIDDYDRRSFSVTIQHASGQVITTELRLYGGGVGRGLIVFDGGGSTIQVNNGNAIANYGPPEFYLVKNVKLKTLTSGYCLIVQVPGYVIVDAVELKGCATAGLVAAASGALLQIGTTLTISGAMPTAIMASDLGLVCGTDAPSVVTLSGSPAFSTTFAYAIAAGVIQPLNFSFSGAASGRRYVSQLNGVILTGTAADPNYFPGTITGLVSLGGQYY